MNERIKELISECTYMITDYSMGIDSSYEEFDKEKFAELIIQECVTKMAIESMEEGIEGAIEATYKHFGIEE